MLLSQEKAVALIREQTGLSIASTLRLVRGLPKTRDGKRDKVNSLFVDKAIRDANEGQPISGTVFTKKQWERMGRTV